MIAQAADTSGAAVGQRYAMTMSERVGSTQVMSVTGSGALNRRPVSGQATLQLRTADAPGGLAGQAIIMHAVLAGDKMFFRFGGRLETQMAVATHTPWLEIDYGHLGPAGTTAGLSSLYNRSLSQGPAAQFKQLAEASTDGLEKVGTATVDGVATTEYSATLDLTKAADDVPAADRSAARRALQAAAAADHVSQLPVKVWIDSDHLIRRMAITFSVAAHGTRTVLTTTQTILAYGRQPVPSAPPASLVTDVTSELNQQTFGASSAG